MGLKPATNPDAEAVTIELSIDGKPVTAKSGVSLYDVISSTTKARQCGFHEVVDSEEMFVRLLGRLRRERVVP